MDSFFGGIKKFISSKKVEIDNYVFRMHYRFTLIILFAFCILVTGRQYIGDPIDCISRDDIPSDLLDTYCWIHPTFSIPGAWHKEVGDAVPYPGIERYTKQEQKVHHAYYQWVCFVLFLQAVLFYFPRYFWKAVEGNRMNNLIQDLNSPVCEKKIKEFNLDLLVQYLFLDKGNNNFYYLCYCLAEIMNLVNVIGQIFLMDRFLGGEFSDYGHKVMQFTGWHWQPQYDPMIKVFPRLAKCTFYKYGSSGSVQQHDAMCILPLNIVNEKIYVFLWFWFIILSIVTCLAILYRFVITASSRLRTLTLHAKNKLVNDINLGKVLDELSIGDWHLLYLLSKNIDDRNFSEVIDKFKTKLDEEKEKKAKEEAMLAAEEKETEMIANESMA